MIEAIKEIVDRLTVQMVDAYDDENEEIGDAYNLAITIVKEVGRTHEQVPEQKDDSH